MNVTGTNANRAKLLEIFDVRQLEIIENAIEDQIRHQQGLTGAGAPSRGAGMAKAALEALQATYYKIVGHYL